MNYLSVKLRRGRDDQLWDGVLLEAVTGREAWSWRRININMQLYDIPRAGDVVA